MRHPSPQPSQLLQFARLPPFVAALQQQQKLSVLIPASQTPVPQPVLPLTESNAVLVSLIKRRLWRAQLCNQARNNATWERTVESLV